MHAHDQTLEMRSYARTPMGWLVACFAVAGCGSDDTGNNTVVVLDTTVDTISVDATSDVDTTPSDNLPPDFGDACSENDDCSTGFCIETPAGEFVCSKTCIDECPVGWSCKGITSGSVDVIFVCVPETEPPQDTVTPDTTEPDDTTTPPDTTPPTDTGPTQPLGNSCDLDPGVGVEAFFTEPGGGDWPDCIVGCDKEADLGLTEIDLRTASASGSLGRIDDNQHTYDVGVGPDIDVIAIRANPRTMLEFSVRAASADSPLDPVLYVSDGFQVRVYSSDVAVNNSCARTVIAYPYVSQLPIFVAIEDALNYASWTPGGWTQTAGGPSYDYTLRINTAPFAPTELGTIAAPGQSLTPSGAISSGGDIHYYRFMAPATANIGVTLTATGGGSTFVPAIAGMKTNEGQLVWQDVGYDGDGNGVVTIDKSSFVVCFGECGSQPVEWIFAVYDWNGASGPGTFSYNLDVRWN